MMDTELLKSAIEDAKYLEYWFGPFETVTTFIHDGVSHKTEDGKTIEEFLKENEGKQMSLVMTLCRKCKHGLHGTGCGMKFLDMYKEIYSKFSIAIL